MIASCKHARPLGCAMLDLSHLCGRADGRRPIAARQWDDGRTRVLSSSEPPGRFCSICLHCHFWLWLGLTGPCGWPPRVVDRDRRQLQARGCMHGSLGRQCQSLNHACMSSDTRRRAANGRRHMTHHGCMAWHVTLVVTVSKRSVRRPHAP